MDRRSSAKQARTDAGNAHRLSDRYHGAQHPMSIERINILGVGVSAVNIPLALETIDRWIACGEQHYVCVSGVHGVIESQRSLEIRTIHNTAGMVVPDGMPLVWLSHYLGFPQVKRVYGPDLMLAIMAHSNSRDYQHYFYGGGSGVSNRLADRLQKMYPRIKIVGTYTPPFRPLTPEEDSLVIEYINKTHPDIIWVGLSTPKQELWMASHLGKVNAPVMIGVGAAFDFNAGLKRQAPGWIQKLGLEWLFRLLCEPKRLWRRYLINNPLFIYLMIGQLLGIKQYRLD